MQFLFLGCPSCRLVVFCLQNGAPDNLHGTSAPNRTLHFTGTAGKQALPGKSKAVECLTTPPRSDQDALALLAVTEAFPVTAKGA